MRICCQQAKNGFPDLSNIQLATSTLMLVKSIFPARKRQQIRAEPVNGHLLSTSKKWPSLRPFRQSSVLWQLQSCISKFFLAKSSKHVIALTKDSLPIRTHHSENRLQLFLSRYISSSNLSDATFNLASHFSFLVLLAFIFPKPQI